MFVKVTYLNSSIDFKYTLYGWVNSMYDEAELISLADDEVQCALNERYGYYATTTDYCEVDVVQVLDSEVPKHRKAYLFTLDPKA